jgi:hypothetical protein
MPGSRPPASQAGRFDLAWGHQDCPDAQSQSGISLPWVSFPKKQSNLTRFFSLKHEFPSEWYRFMHSIPSASSQVMSIPVTNERFPFQYRGKKISVSQMAGTGKVEIQPRVSAASPRRQVADG